MDLEETSKLIFTESLEINSTSTLSLYGAIKQTKQSLGSPSVQTQTRIGAFFKSEGNVTLSSMHIQNMGVVARNIFLLDHANISTPTSIDASGFYLSGCRSKQGFSNLTCTDGDLFPYGNHSLVFNGKSSLIFSNYSSVYASAIILCSPEIVIQKRSLLSANSRGCLCGEGQGAGQSSSSTNSGGGGGG